MKKRVLIGIGIGFLIIMLVLPLLVIITEAFSEGWNTYKEAILNQYTRHAFFLTLQATGAALTINTVFGVCAAWAITKYQFPGKKLLITLIDVPFAVSPVIAGLIFSLTFGRLGWAHSIMKAVHIKVLFAVPGIIIATIFVTFPFICKELLPVLYAQGNSEEEAGALMGAGGFTIFRTITFPHIKWALLYGMVLCAARAMGEFGAVSVISGHLRGKTNTLPLHVEILYNEFQFSQAFAVSTILVILAIGVLVIKSIAESKSKREGEGQ